MYSIKDFPWHQEYNLNLEDIIFVKNLIRLEKRGELRNLQEVKQIRARDRYLPLTRYFELLEHWEENKEEYYKFEQKDLARKKYFKERVGTNSFWPVKVARFIRGNNLSDNPEKDLFICLKENDIKLYIEWIFEKEIFGSVIEIGSPIKIEDLTFFDPTKKCDKAKHFPEANAVFRDLQKASLKSKRLNDTLSLLLSPGMIKEDKILILNYFINKEAQYTTANYLNTKYPKIYTQRVWKSLLSQKNLLLLPKEIILKIYNNYRKVQPLNGGLGSVIKGVTGVGIRRPTRDYPFMTKAEKERLNIWKNKLNNQQLQR